nr:SEC14-like protein 2 [Parasteatoda tepidariorum]XP_042911569.1 SEC14-like protein 2 [Parasteatoda tepidariorum]XP_042911570.1 SEC14-like protein 2 [Parasteatoda tepidariorum]
MDVSEPIVDEKELINKLREKVSDLDVRPEFNDDDAYYRKWLKARSFNLEKAEEMFRKDSAPSHASKVTQKFLTDQQVLFLRPEQWISNSPDAAPCDYFLWGHLKNKLIKRRISTLRGLQRAIREVVMKIPQEIN